MTDMTSRTDIVITYVDFTCKQWRAEYERAITELYDANIHTRDSATRTRFVNHGELRFLLRSVNKNMPWVRTVYIVVDDYLVIPSWININTNNTDNTDNTDNKNSSIKIVRHSELFPFTKLGECLPTFNSQAIETVIHRIPGISDPFIYFNDDMFVGRTIKPDDLIQQPNDDSNQTSDYKCKCMCKCAVLLTTDHSKYGTPSINDIGFRCAWKNVNRILNEHFEHFEHFSHSVRYKLEHAPYIISPRLMEQIWTIFNNEMEYTMRSRFRSIHDINVSPALHPYYALHTDVGFIPTGISVKTIYTNLQDKATTRSKLSNILSTVLPHFFCIEDEDGCTESDNSIRRFLEAHFPDKSIYESEDLESIAPLSPVAPPSTPEAHTP